MTKLKPFQIEGVQQIYQFDGRALLADEMGLGKTIQALDWVRRIPRRRPVIIVTPASVKFNWQAEAALHFGMRTEVLEGKRKKRQMSLPGDIVILNYDILKSWLPALLKHDPQVVIIDEAQYVKNVSSKRTKAVLKLTENAASVVALSGTPLTNRPIELWPVLQAVNPTIFPDRSKFAWRYCKPRYTPWGWQYDGAAHLDELHKILKRTCMIRRLKKDVLKELPDKSRRMVSFKLDSYEEYHRAETEFLEWLKGISPMRAKKAKKSQALTKVGYLLRLVAKLKLRWTEQWIRDFLEAHPREKLIVFTMNTFVIDHLRERFKSRCVFIDGRVTGRLRQETVRKFQNNRQVELLVGNWMAAGIGINLQAARYVAALDFPWTPADLLQGEDRAHRIGQKRDVMVFYLAALDTIEEKQIKLLKKKSKILDAVLNGEASEEDLNFFEDLLTAMKR